MFMHWAIINIVVIVLMFDPLCTFIIIIIVWKIFKVFKIWLEINKFNSIYETNNCEGLYVRNMIKNFFMNIWNWKIWSLSLSKYIYIYMSNTQQ